MRFRHIKDVTLTAFLAGCLAAGSFSSPVFAADASAAGSSTANVKAAGSQDAAVSVTLDDGTTITCPEGWDSEDPEWIKEYIRLYRPESAQETLLKATSGTMTAFSTYTKTTWKKNGGGTVVAYHDSRNTSGSDLVPLIDVSKWEGSINWEKVKADGIDYALIRVGYQGASNGTLNEDPYYKSYIEGALAAGVKVGVYIYSQAISEDEAVEQADYIIDRIENYDIELPVVFDYEYYTSTSGRLYKAHLSKAKKTSICKAFCEETQERGYDPMLYAGSVFLRQDMDGDDFGQSYPIWIARYNSYLYKASSSVPASALYQGDVEIWQNSSSAAVSGINHAVDFNYWYKDPDWESGNPGYNGGSKGNITDNPFASMGTALTVSSKSKKNIKLKWPKVSGATGYRIFRSGAYDGVYTEVDLGADTTSYKFTGLSAGREYYFTIQPVQGDNDGKESSILSVMTSGVKSGLKYKVTASSLNMRSHAGTSSVCRKIKSLKKGSTVTYKGQTRSSSGSVWYKVKSGTSTGYVKASYLKKA